MILMKIFIGMEIHTSDLNGEMEPDQDSDTAIFEEFYIFRDRVPCPDGGLCSPGALQSFKLGLLNILDILIGCCD